MTHSLSPGSWRDYCALVAASSTIPDPRLNRFRARYRVAAAFDGASFQSLSRATQQGYTSLLRLALSYAALESLCSALDLRVTRQVLDDADLASRLRSTRARRLAEVMRTDVGTPLRQRLEELLNSQASTDVMPAAAFYRHKFLHGDLTATRAGAGRTAWERQISDGLADLLLVRADVAFSAHVMRLRTLKQ